VLWVTDVSASGRMAEQAPDTLKASATWLIRNKIDLAVDKSCVTKGRSALRNEYGFCYLISAVNGDGIEGLVTALGQFARDYFVMGESGIVTRARHRRALEETVAALDRALSQAANADPREELIAEELRAAATMLGRLTGRVDVEDILDVIFRDFCIGK
jgi:tRNA modification GTPase